MIQVGVLDDHPMVLWGIERALHDRPEIAVAATVSDPADLDVAALDVLLLDVYLGGQIPSTALVTRFAPDVAVLLMSASYTTADIDAGLRAGARGFLHKSSPAETIATAIGAAARGEPVAVAPAPAQPATAPGGVPLSPREQQVIQLIGDGFTHDQIARRLVVSKHTVDTYIKRVRAKLGLGNKAELARAAYRLSHRGSPIE